MQAGKMGGGSCASSLEEVVRLFVMAVWGEREEAATTYDSSQNPMTAVMERNGKQEL
jgi:hypothetical protein